MIRAFPHHGHLLKEFNNTHITLITKKENLTKVNDFSPINLPNVFINLSLNYWKIGLEKFFLIDFTIAKCLYP